MPCLRWMRNRDGHVRASDSPTAGRTPSEVTPPEVPPLGVEPRLNRF
jgi:hypothetical protein